MNIFSADLFCDAAIYTGAVLGMWIAFRILSYPDLALEQLFVLGGVAFALFGVQSHGFLTLCLILPVVALLLGFLCSIIRNRYRIHAVLISLIAAYAYYSFALALLKAPNIYFGNMTPRIPATRFGLIALGVYGVFTTILALAAKTSLGLRVIASGSNWNLAHRHSLAPTIWQAIGLAIAFLLVLSSGALFAWRLGYIDVASGNGLLLISIFVVLVTRTCQPRINMGANSVILFITLLAYLTLVQTAIALGMSPHWLRGLTSGALLVLLLFLPRNERKLLSL